MRVTARQVSPELRALFDVDQPLAIRCFAVLDGSIRGRIWTDDLVHPTWGAVQEVAFNTLFLGGQPNVALVRLLVATQRQDAGVALALWPHHVYNELLPPAPDFDGWALGFTHCAPAADPVPELAVPAGCALRPVDATWFLRCRYRHHYLANFGNAARALARGFGFCVVQGQELLSEAFAADSALGMVEIGTITGEPQRGRGLATLCCAKLIRECETRGYRTYWNCAKDNLASANLARKLGYQTEKAYRFVAWEPRGR